MKCQVVLHAEHSDKVYLDRVGWLSWSADSTLPAVFNRFFRRAQPQLQCNVSIMDITHSSQRRLHTMRKWSANVSATTSCNASLIDMNCTPGSQSNRTFVNRYGRNCIRTTMRFDASHIRLSHRCLQLPINLMHLTWCCCCQLPV